MAPTGSSILTLSKNKTEKTTSTPAREPIIIELVGVTLAHPAVIPTSPARAPFKLMPTSGLPNLNHDTIMATMDPAAAARFVLTKIMAVSLLAAVVEPGLNPNQPSQRIKTPMAAKGIL